MRLEGKVALITGAARGLGEAQARLFAREGARIALADVLENDGKRIEEAIKGDGGEAFFIKLDVTDEEAWRNVINTTVARYGRLDILVNNAGVSSGEGLEDMPREVWERIMEVNATGVFLGTKAAIPELRKAGGSIVNISSQLGLVGSDFSNPAYHASKAAVHIFTKSVAVRYASEGIRANSVHPGPVRTPMLEDTLVSDELTNTVTSRIPMGRIGRPEEVAYGVLYLASDEASFVTGAGLVIDGGWTAQ